MSTTEIVTIIVAIIGSGSISALIQFFVKRHDTKNDVFKELKDSIEKLDKKVDALETKTEEAKAMAARMRIIRFADEIITRTGKSGYHSLGHYLAILDDVSLYEEHCRQNPTSNGHGKEACKLIHKTFNDLVEKGEFVFDEDE